MQGRDHFSTNSALSEGWVVRCVCGAKKDDGKPMIECEECKVSTCTALQACRIDLLRIVRGKHRMHWSSPLLDGWVHTYMCCPDRPVLRIYRVSEVMHGLLRGRLRLH